MQAQAQKERSAKLAIIDSILWGAVPSMGFLGRFRGEVMAYVTLRLIRAVTIRVEDISLTLRVENLCDTSIEPAGVGHSQSGRNKVDGSAIICMSVRSFSVGSQAGKVTPGVDLQTELNGLSLTVTPPISTTHPPSRGMPYRPARQMLAVIGRQQLPLLAEAYSQLCHLWNLSCKFGCHT
jgi:hypothetical protein